MALGAVLALGGCKHADAGETAGERVVTVFAGAGTTDALTEIGRRYEAESGVKVRFSFAASSTVAKQIAAGARADVFVSANAKWMDFLAERELIRPGTRRELVGNRLALIAPKASSVNVSTGAGRAPLADAFEGRLAVGDPSHVPAGEYTRQAFQRLGWWDGVKDRLDPAQTVRAALGAVETGRDDLGVVYATDAARSAHVRVVTLLPADSHPPIRFPAAVCRDAGREADAFLDYLAGGAAADIFREHGFEWLGQSPATAGAQD